jgi:predicted enzyme related to lactoylglutathione lyase
MELPKEARKMGATPRWVGYVSVKDIDGSTERLKRRGGTVYVPPTNSNIGRISVVADPHKANFALVNGLKLGGQRPADFAKPGRVGWNELLAGNWSTAFEFYSELFGWQAAGEQTDLTVAYQLFSGGGQTIGGMFTKSPEDPIPFWLFYFNVGDIEAAAERVKAGGGQVFKGPTELPGGGWVARCRDPQGGAFALQGTRSVEGFGWTSEWAGFSSKGRLVTKPRR